jgi:hypothetical protein
VKVYTTLVRIVHVWIKLLRAFDTDVAQSWPGLCKVLVSLGCLLMFLGSAQAQIVVPTFATRGDVDSQVAQEFMSALRGELGRRTGLVISEGELITAGIAGSLDPVYTAYIANIEQLRYAISGEIRSQQGGRGNFVVSVLMADAADNRSSDVISESLSAVTVTRTAATIAEQFLAFIQTEASLEVGTAGLFVSTQPGEAAVFINGIEVGRTSDLSVLMLRPGSYQVEFRKEGFLPAQRRVTLREGVTELLNVQLTAVAGGSIQITSRPAAQVFINDEAVGQSPLTHQVAPGTTVVRLERPGFETLRFEVPVQTYRVTRVDRQLLPRFSPMIFWSQEEGGLVTIGGTLRLAGYIPDLEPGRYEVELRRQGRRKNFMITVPPTGVYEIDFEQERLIELGQ